MGILEIQSELLFTEGTVLRTAGVSTREKYLDLSQDLAMLQSSNTVQLQSEDLDHSTNYSWSFFAKKFCHPWFFPLVGGSRG
jgi:hypothetical protein